MTSLMLFRASSLCLILHFASIEVVYKGISTINDVVKVMTFVDVYMMQSLQFYKGFYVNVFMLHTHVLTYLAGGVGVMDTTAHHMCAQSAQIGALNLWGVTPFCFYFVSIKTVELLCSVHVMLCGLAAKCYTLT